MKKSVFPYYSKTLEQGLVLAFLAALALTGSASAASITVPDFSFETPADTSSTTPYFLLGTASTTGAADAFSGWNYTTNNVRGYYAVSTSVLTTPGTSQGSQAAYLQVYNGSNFGTLSTANSLGTISANTLYTLTVAVGAPATWGTPANGANKTAGETAGEAILSLTDNGTIFATQSVAENVVSQGTLVDYTVTFTTGASGGPIGNALGISLESLKVNYPSGDPGLESDIFDDVRLTAVSTIPEPATWALFLGGAGFLTVLVRRNWLKI